MFLSMTGANSHLPTLVYQNLSSATHSNGMTDGPGSVDLTRTIQKTISFSSLISSSDPIRIGSGQKDIVKEIELQWKYDMLDKATANLIAV